MASGEQNTWWGSIVKAAKEKVSIYMPSII